MPIALPRAALRLGTKNVEFHADPEALALLGATAKARTATESDWSTEYNDYVLNVRIVDGVDAAIAHIHQYGSGHSDAIITAEAATAAQFQAAVDSAAVYWNASTRFTDGNEFGMGAEIGISTDKIGARGPMGLEELCAYKWLGYGTGQVRA